MEMLTMDSQTGKLAHCQVQKKILRRPMLHAKFVKAALVQMLVQNLFFPFFFGGNEILSPHLLDSPLLLRAPVPQPPLQVL